MTVPRPPAATGRVRPASSVPSAPSSSQAGARDAGSHWDRVYRTTPLSDVSWYQRQPATSLRLLADTVPRDVPVVDVGAGTSLLTDALLDTGFRDVTVLDVSTEALARVRERLRGRAGASFVEADLLAWQPERRYGGWHDRAVFHFLTTQANQRRYVQTAARAVAQAGHVVLGVFGADGPTSCSGLPTSRYDVDGLARLFDAHFTLLAAERERHVTPTGAVQPFTWVVLRRH